MSDYVAILVGSPNHIGGPTRSIRDFVDNLGKLGLKENLYAAFDTYPNFQNRCQRQNWTPPREAESRIQELLGKRSDSKSEADALKEKVAGLESRMTEAEKELDAARNRIKELEASVAKPPTEEKPSKPTAA